MIRQNIDIHNIEQISGTNQDTETTTTALGPRFFTHDPHAEIKVEDQPPEETQELVLLP